MKNILKKLKSLVGKTAPILASAIDLTGGGAAIGMIANILGVGDDPDKMVKAIESNPELALEFEKIQSEKKVQLEEIAMKLDLAYLADRQDARHREIEVQKAGGSNIPLYTLAGVNTVGFFAFAIMSALGAVDDSTIMNLMVGALIANFTSVINYFFGSSQGSKNKTKMLAK